jgi:hypothetical protein
MLIEYEFPERVIPQKNIVLGHSFANALEVAGSVDVMMGNALTRTK